MNLIFVFFLLLYVCMYLPKEKPLYQNKRNLEEEAKFFPSRFWVLFLRRIWRDGDVVWVRTTRRTKTTVIVAVLESSSSVFITYIVAKLRGVSVSYCFGFVLYVFDEMSQKRTQDDSSISFSKPNNLEGNHSPDDKRRKSIPSFRRWISFFLFLGSFYLFIYVVFFFLWFCVCLVCFWMELGGGFDLIMENIDAHMRKTWT